MYSVFIITLNQNTEYGDGFDGVRLSSDSMRPKPLAYTHAFYALISLEPTGTG